MVKYLPSIFAAAVASDAAEKKCLKLRTVIRKLETVGTCPPEYIEELKEKLRRAEQACDPYETIQAIILSEL